MAVVDGEETKARVIAGRRLRRAASDVAARNGNEIRCDGDGVLHLSPAPDRRRRSPSHRPDALLRRGDLAGAGGAPAVV